VSLPYSVQTNDVPAYFEMKVSVPEFEAMLRRQFDTLYREGETIPRVMAIAVHPFVTGQLHRIGALDAALEYICSHAGVWRHRLGDRAALPGSAIEVSGGCHLPLIGPPWRACRGPAASVPA